MCNLYSFLLDRLVC